MPFLGETLKNTTTSTSTEETSTPQEETTTSKEETTTPKEETTTSKEETSTPKEETSTMSMVKTTSMAKASLGKLDGKTDARKTQSPEEVSEDNTWVFEVA